MLLENIYSIYKEHPVITTDSRNIIQNSIFFALKGENFNGNAYSASALEQGASYAVIDEEKYKINDRYILVDNVLETLQALASLHRDNLSIPIIGITGTNGKTTTKELLHAVLSQKYKCYATKGNLNNHIGVPLTILSIPQDTEIAIIEMGANALGEIAALCHIAKPAYGIITNIGKAHLQGFGSIEGVMKTKQELYTSVAYRNGTLFVNHDNEILKSLLPQTPTIFYGIQTEAGLQGKVLESNPFLKFAYTDSQKNYEIQSNLVGSYNLENMLAAITIGRYFGVSHDQIECALTNYSPTNNRSQEIRTAKNQIIMDAYNANPSSMALAIQNFAEMKYGQKMLILGDMLELGDQSAAEHQNIVELLKKYAFDNVILVGEEFIKTKTDNYLIFETAKEVVAFLQMNPVKEKVILIKGSRGIKLETLLDVL